MRGKRCVPSHDFYVPPQNSSIFHSYDPAAAICIVRLTIINRYNQETGTQPLVDLHQQPLIGGIFPQQSLGNGALYTDASAFYSQSANYPALDARQRLASQLVSALP